MSSRLPARAAPFVLAATAAILPAPAAQAHAAKASCASATAMPSELGRHQVVRSTLCLLNLERHKHRLRALHLNSLLSKAARRHSRDMVRRGYFAHVSPGGTTFGMRIRRTGYLRSTHSWVIGENLAWGSGYAASPRSITRAWMNSPGHRKNILTPGFRDIGIGIVRAGPVRGALPEATYSTEFGVKRG